MTLVDRHFRPLDLDAAAAALRALYRIDAAELHPLAGERTQNFHVRSESDGEFVLKICPHDESLEQLTCQHAAMQHVQRHARDVAVPAPVADSEGETMPLLSMPDADPVRVRVLRFVPGRELGTIPHHGERLLESIGALLGRVSWGGASRPA